jgi:hypothetical protein
VKGSKHANAFRDVLGGTFSHQLYGSNECKHFKSRDEEFYSILVEIKNKKNLQECLDAFVEGELLEGGNAFKCGKCNKKVDTVRRTVIKKLPPTLCVVLKRFELDFTTWQPVKVNDRVEFPKLINMKGYTEEALTSEAQLKMAAAVKAENDKPAPAKAAEGKAAAAAPTEGKANDTTTTTAAVPTEGKKTAAEEVVEAEEEGVLVSHPDEYYQYKLKGIVVHTGTAHGGHYYSFIQERLRGDTGNEAKWYKFNDNVVTEFDPKKIEEECFGGTKGPRTWGGIANGYCLFYDRVEAAEVKVEEVDANGDKISFEAAAETLKAASKIKQKVALQRSRAPVPPKIFGEIWDQNLTYWRDKNVYDPAYFEFLWDLVNKSKSNAALGQASEAKFDMAAFDVTKPYNELDALTRITTRFLLNTLSRSAVKDSATQWLGKIKALYTNNVPSSAWLLNMVTHKKVNWLQEYFFSCPFPAIRKGVCDMIAEALKNVGPYEKASYTASRVPTAAETAAAAANAVVAVESKDAEVEVAVVEPTLAAIAKTLETVPQQDSRGFIVGFMDKLLSYFSATAKYQKKFSNYFNVVETFAGLGDGEVAYLSGFNMVARIIDLYLGSRSPHPELTVASVDPVTGQAVRPQLEAPNLTPIFGVLAKLVKGNITKLNELGLEMVTHKAFLQPLLMEAVSFQHKNTVVSLVQEIVTHNPAAFSDVYQFMGKSFEVHQYTQTRPFFRVLTGLCELKDNKTNEMMAMLTGAFTFNSTSSWKMTDFIVDYIIRLAKRFPAVKDWLKANPATVDTMSAWLNKYQKPPANLDPAAGIVAERKMLRHGCDSILYQTTFFAYTQSSKYCAHNLPTVKKIAALEIIKGGNPLDTDQAEDSDYVRGQRTFAVEQKVDALDTDAKWLAAFIKEVKSTVIKVSFTGYDPKWDEWFAHSSPKIAELGQFSKSEPSA